MKHNQIRNGFRKWDFLSLQNIIFSYIKIVHIFWFQIVFLLNGSNPKHLQKITIPLALKCDMDIRTVSLSHLKTGDEFTVPGTFLPCNLAEVQIAPIQ